MMMMMKKYVLALGLLAALTAGCNRGDDEKGELKVTAKHHENYIDSCMVYIKYGSVNPPLDGKYDDSAKCVMEGGIPVATFSNLSMGNYYLYAYGWDPKFTPPSHVKGAYAYPLQQGGTQHVELAVSEI
jgi:hypothetical protein